MSEACSSCTLTTQGGIWERLEALSLDCRFFFDFPLVLLRSEIALTLPGKTFGGAFAQIMAHLAPGEIKVDSLWAHFILCHLFTWRRTWQNVGFEDIARGDQ